MNIKDIKISKNDEWVSCIGSLQSHAFRGGVEKYAPTIAASMGEGMAQIPMISNIIGMTPEIAREIIKLAK